MGSTVVLSVQDDLLRQAVEVYGGKNWKKIGAFLNFQTRRNRESRAFERALDVRAKR
jgi:DNA-binding transcriptional regulator/RsmH inhibitor MraZ